MPTTHYASRQFLEQKGLDIDWQIDITNPQKKKREINGNDKKLKRASDEIVWVRDGGEHPVYILHVEDSASDDTDDDMVWVQWLSNGKKECIYRNQIIKDGLQGRKRQRANFYAEDKDMDVPEHIKKNKSKKIKKSVSPVRVSRYLSPQYQAEKKAEDSAVEDQDVNVSENNKKNKSEKNKSSEHIDCASSEAVEEDDVPTTDHKVSDETCPVDGKAAQVKGGLYSREGYTQKEFNAKMQQLQSSQLSNPKQQQYSMQPQYQQKMQPQYIDRVSQPYAEQVFGNQAKVSNLQMLTCDTLQHSNMMLQCGMQLVANAINRHKAEFFNLLKTKTSGGVSEEMNEIRKSNLAVAMKAANVIMLSEQVVLSQLIKAEQEATDLCIFALQKEKKDGFIGTNHRSSEYLCLPPKPPSAQRRQGKQSEGTGKDHIEEANKIRDS